MGYTYWGPYLTSPDKRYMAASIAAARHAPGSPGFVIVDTQVNQTVAVIKGSDERFIDGLAWSPDSKWVAVLKYSYRPAGYRPIDLLGYLTGHPVPYMSYYIEVVNLAGDKVAQSKPSSELRGSWAWVVWIE